MICGESHADRMCDHPAHLLPVTHRADPVQWEPSAATPRAVRVISAGAPPGPRQDRGSVVVGLVGPGAGVCAMTRGRGRSIVCGPRSAGASNAPNGWLGVVYLTGVSWAFRPGFRPCSRSADNGVRWNPADRSCVDREVSYQRKRPAERGRGADFCDLIRACGSPSRAVGYYSGPTVLNPSRKLMETHRRRSSRGSGNVREVHRPREAGGRSGSGRSQDAQPQLHRHRAHPPGFDPRG